MKKLALLTAVISLLLLASCQQEPDEDMTPVTNPDPNPAAPANRVKTYTEHVAYATGEKDSASYTLSYDNSGRMTSMISTLSPGDKFVFSYPSATMYTLDLYNAGARTIHVDFYLNALGLTDSTFQYNDTEDTTTEGYTYNATSQLVTLKEYEYSESTGAVLDNTTTYTYDAAGNLTKETSTDHETITYEYYPDLIYAQPLIFGPLTAATTKKKPLLKALTLSSSGSLVGHAVSTYTFDDKDRITTEKAVIDDGSTVVKTYTYF